MWRTLQAKWMVKPLQGFHIMYATSPACNNLFWCPRYSQKMGACATTAWNLDLALEEQDAGGKPFTSHNQCVWFDKSGYESLWALSTCPEQWEQIFMLDLRSFEILLISSKMTPWVTVGHCSRERTGPTTTMRVGPPRIIQASHRPRIQADNKKRVKKYRTVNSLCHVLFSPR